MKIIKFGMVWVLASLSVNVFAAGLAGPSNTPLETGMSSAVKPNIMFVLDDSGSMAWDFLGDQVGNKKLCKTGTETKNWNNWVNGITYGSSSSCNSAKPSNTTTTQYQCAGNNNKTLQSRTYVNSTYSYANFDDYCSLNNSNSNPINTSTTTPDIIYFAYDVNNIYYNPNMTYQPAITSTGASMGNQTLAAAKTDVFGGSASTINLTTINEVYYCTISNPSAAQLSNTTYCKRNGVDTAPGNGVAFDYITEGFPNGTYVYQVKGKSVPFYYSIITREFCNYNGVTCSSGQSASTPTPFPVRWCSSTTYATQATIPTGSGKCQANYDPTNYPYPRYGKFQRSDVSADQYVNYANWYTYYRTRMNTVKTAIGISFDTLDSSKRVGFLGMNSDSFVPVGDFTQSQKTLFYTALYAEAGNSGTNLKDVISSIGRYYANKTSTGHITSIAEDPVQYSCQQNFTMLATDGYWNSGTNGKDLSNNTLGNYDKNNTAATYDLRSDGAYDGAYDGALSGSTGTLADAAMYYYKTPLRSASLNNCTSSSSGASQNLCPTQPNVPISASDQNPNIHMNFYALSLGINGLMTYVKDYYRGAATDLQNIKNSVAATGGVCSWTTGTCNWPVPSGDDPAAIDDLWHATINGRGRYFSANNAGDVISGLQDALASVTAMTGASSAAATSSPNITATNNYLYYTTYRTLKWDGEIAAKIIEPTTGVLSSTISWSARALLNGKVSASADTRNIYFLHNVSGTTPSSTLTGFDYANMSAIEKAYFDNKASIVPYTQYPNLSSSNQTLANTGSNLIKYLRGQNGYEESNATYPLYRGRDFILGDIVDTSPNYVGGAKYNWTNSGYSSFVSAKNGRVPAIYAAANDGMIHSFNATTGQENWAIIPAQVMGKMYKLADNNYSYNHQFFVDGSMTSMDALVGGSWKTIVVTGMGSGGTGYVALDITDPLSPVPMWEICKDSTVCSQSDSELGYSFSNPIVTQRDYDKKWVVYVTSGYDNSTGKGILYELEIETGKVLRKLYVGTGSGGTPSAANQVGLGKMNAYFDNFSITNSAKAIYVGDLNGDMWKFDLTNSGSTTGILLGSAKNATGVAQPITTKPEVGMINNSRVIYFGTGQYLNSSDQASTSQQSFYAIKDTNASLGNLRSDSKMIAQTITGGTITSTSSTNNVDWTVNDGWYFDFKSQAGERVNVDPILVLGNINILTNVPYSSICTAGGNSWYYQVDYTNGQALPGQSNIISKKLTGGLAVGQSIVMLSGPGIIKNFITDAQGNVTPTAVTGNAGTSVTKAAKKMSWREFLKR